MKPRLAFLLAVLLAGIALAACTLHKGGGIGSGGSNTTLSVTALDTPPANSSILSFRVTVTGITLNPASGSPFALPLSSGPFGSSPVVVEFTRLQSDSAFLGTFTTVPAGTYNSVTIALSNAELTFANQTTGTITLGTTTCPTNSVCTVSGITPIQPPAISFGTPGLTLSTTSPQGISLDFNLSNAITFTSTTTSTALSLDFSQPNAVTAATLPRGNSNLPTGQLDLIEDFTGVVTALNTSTQSVTVQSATRGTITAAANSSTIFDPDPSGTRCTISGFSSCVQQNETVSIDAILNADGTLTLQELEPLVSAASSPEDLIEGVVDSVSSTNTAQFQLVVSGKELVGSTSQLANLNIGDQVQITIAAGGSFSVDTKHLSSGTGFPMQQTTTFKSATDNSVLAAGQVVSVHVPASSFTAATGTMIASATVNSVMLRWSRITGTVQSASNPNFDFNPSTLPTFIPQGVPANTGIPSFGATTLVQTFSGITNFDGFTSTSNFPTTGDSVTARALFFRSPSFVFTAAKVRKH